MMMTFLTHAQNNHGTYYNTSYSPKDYALEDISTSPQNWGVAQDNRGVMYFCNTSGILEFDGIHWNMVEGTENQDMFKAVCGADGRIYTGGRDEIGFLGLKSEQAIGFHSLKHLLPDTLQDFGTVRMVKAIGDSIAFLSPFHLFIYHKDNVTVYPSKDRYGRLFNYGGRIVVQLYKAGLYELRGGELIPLHENIMPNSQIIRHMFGSPSKPILVGNRDGLLQIDDGKVKYQPSTLDTLTLWNGNSLNNNIHAIGSNEKGAVIIDEHSQIKEIFHAEYGLSGHSVVSPFFDRNKQLWLASSNGIQHIEYIGQFSLIDEDLGVKGIPLCIDETDEEIMIGTTEGLFVRGVNTQKFEKVELESQKQADEFVTDFLDIVNDKLILTSHGLFQKNGKNYVRLNDVGGFKIAIVNSSEAKLVYGGDEVMVFVNKSQGKWQSTLTIDTLNLNTLDVSAQNDNRFWITMFSIAKVDLLNKGVAKVTMLDSTHGFIPEMGPIWSFILHDKAYFCTAIGLYSWNESKQLLEADDLLGDEFSRGLMGNPIVVGDTAVWLSHEDGVGYVDLDTKEFIDRDLRRVDYSDVWGIHPTKNGHFWILTTEAIVRYDPSVDNSYQEGFNTLIRGVTTKEDSVLFGGFFASSSGAPSLIQPDSMQPFLDFSHNQLSIRYSASYYNAADKITFSTYLEGQDENWSSWSSQPFKDFMNLREGDYTFKVKSRNVYGAEGSVASYSFSIKPPWYRSTWAYIIYAILGGLGIWGIAVLYSLRLRRQKIALEGIVRDRTREIAEEKQKSDNLLLNILPEETATELKNQGYATTRSYEEVSVLFTDFVSFSAISEKMSPEDLVAEINECFIAFDDIIENEGVEKIKTIGDAYMCASGLNHDTALPEVRIVRVGIAIREFMKARNEDRKEKGLPYFRIRIGIHTGPVVAGVVGKKKFAYDIWGDTVNTAARMESNSQPGELNISASTYEIVKDAFECEYRGKIEAKNKGKLDMYFVRDKVEVDAEEVGEES